MRNYLLLAVYIVLLLLVAYSMPRSVSWIRTYSAAHTLPFGSKALSEQIKTLFGNKNIFTNTLPFANFNSHNKQQSNFIVVTEKLPADNLDISAIMDYVEAGNNLFIAAEELPDTLQTLLGVYIAPNYNYLQKAIFDGKDSVNAVSLQLTFSQPQSYFFKSSSVVYNIHRNKKPTQEHSKIETLGTQGERDTVFMRIQMGNGFVYLHTFPDAFTNFHLLYGNNHHYISGCLSYLPAQATYWDEYYKPYNNTKSGTPLRYVLTVPAYRWAYFVAIFGVLFFVVFSAKRRQRAIPVVADPPNLTLEFARTLGALYHNEENHGDLITKRMIFLKEKIRNKYSLSTEQTDDRFYALLSSKSGVPRAQVEKLFALYDTLLQQTEITDLHLKTFSQNLDAFYLQSNINH